MKQNEIAEAMQRLNAAERARREAIDTLIRLGVVRSKRLVADLGEAIASRFYGVPLVDNANEPVTTSSLVMADAFRSAPCARRRRASGASWAQ